MAELQQYGATQQGIVQPLSLSDSMRNWGEVRDNQMARDQRIADQPMVDQQNKMKIGLQQHQAAKEVSSAFLESLDSHAKRMGVQPDTPEYQQLANQVYQAGNFAQTMQNITGKPADPNKNVDYHAAQAIAGSTPGEQAQAEDDRKFAMEQKLNPLRIEVAKAGADNSAGNDLIKAQYADQLARGRDQQNYQQDVAMRSMPTVSDIQRKEEKQQEISAKQQEKTQAIDSRIGAIDDQISNLNRLTELQSKTKTGPFIGSGPVATARKMSGDDDLAKLEKGYAKASLDAIGIMKEAGVTLGALSDGEKKWIEKANMSIDSTNSVNQDMMDEGKKHLGNIRKRLEAQKQGKAAINNEAPWGDKKPPREPSQGMKWRFNQRTGDWAEAPIQ
jgi:hypothetical protein